MILQWASAQPLYQKSIYFDGPDLAGNLYEPSSQKSQTWTDFNDIILFRGIDQSENGINNAFMDEKILTESLLRMEGRSTKRCPSLLIKSDHKSFIPLTLKCCNLPLKGQIGIGVEAKIVSMSVPQPVIATESDHGTVVGTKKG